MRLSKSRMTLAVLACLFASSTFIDARPSMGRVGGGGGGRVGGGGGARPSMGGGSRPSMSRPPSVSRPPAVSRPSPTTRPSVSPSTRPASIQRPTTRPSVGAQATRPTTRPSIGDRPGLGSVGSGANRPTTLPGTTRPNIKPPGSLPPTSRPTPLPGRPGDRPSIANRPGIANRPMPLPSQPGIRPPVGARPERPGIANRPGLENRPGIPRPDRPVVGGDLNRPGIANRPNIGVGNINRPNIGVGNVNRPVIGGNNNNININRPNLGGNNINVNRPVIGSGNINNRPGWGIDPGFSRPHWGNYWQDHCVRPNYHGWYHGCWHGHWSNSWYVPLAVGGTIWSLNALTSSWGYGPTYYNPYYVAAPTAVVAPYDYSQPVVINNYIPADDSTESPDNAEQPAPSSPVVSSFDEARTAFKQGDYSSALAKVDESIKLDGKDPVMHEFRALCLFAKGDYQQAAAALNSLLATAPGMDWTTVSGLYGDVDDYSKQLRQLEDYCRDNKNDAASRFVLAYHYLVLGHSDQAVDLLKRIVELQPQDKTAQRMLAALDPPKQEAEPPTPSADSDSPQTDLVGQWKAKAGESTIELAITEDSNFTWKATMPNQPAKEIQGTVSTGADTLSLETQNSGNMVGKVKSGGPDKFTFQMQGMLPGEPGLVFDRVK